MHQATGSGLAAGPCNLTILATAISEAPFGDMFDCSRAGKASDLFALISRPTAVPVDQPAVSQRTGSNPSMAIVNSVAASPVNVTFLPSIMAGPLVTR